MEQKNLRHGNYVWEYNYKKKVMFNLKSHLRKKIIIIIIDITSEVVVIEK